VAPDRVIERAYSNVDRFVTFRNVRLQTDTNASVHNASTSAVERRSSVNSAREINDNTILSTAGISSGSSNDDVYVNRVAPKNDTACLRRRL